MTHNDEYIFISAKYPEAVLVLKTSFMKSFLALENIRETRLNYKFKHDPMTNRIEVTKQNYELLNDLNFKKRNKNAKGQERKWIYRDYKLIEQVDGRELTANIKIYNNYIKTTASYEVTLTKKKEKDDEISRQWLKFKVERPEYKEPTEKQRTDMHNRWRASQTNKNNGRCYIKNRWNGLYLDIYKQRKTNGTKLIVWPLNGGDNQQFEWNGLHMKSVSTGDNMIVTVNEDTGYIELGLEHNKSLGRFFLYDKKEKVIRSTSGKVIGLERMVMQAGENVGLFNYDENEVLKLHKQWDLIYVPSFEIVNTLSGEENGRAKRLKYENKFYFWKQYSSGNVEAFREEAASTLAAHLTDAVIPLQHSRLRSNEEGVYGEWVDFDNVHIFNNNMDFNTLTHEQQTQLFVHVITDRIISNYNTGARHYRMYKGNVFSFSKEKAWKHFKLTGSCPESINSLDITTNHSKKPSLNLNFVKAIEDGRIRIDFHHPKIQNFFKRCDDINYLFLYRILHQYANLETDIGLETSNFVEFMYKRIRGIREQCYRFFKFDPTQNQPLPTNINYPQIQNRNLWENYVVINQNPTQNKPTESFYNHQQQHQQQQQEQQVLSQFKQFKPIRIEEPQYFSNVIEAALYCSPVKPVIIKKLKD